MFTSQNVITATDFVPQNQLDSNNQSFYDQTQQQAQGKTRVKSGIIMNAGARCSPCNAPWW